MKILRTENLPPVYIAVESEVGGSERRGLGIEKEVVGESTSVKIQLSSASRC